MKLLESPPLDGVVHELPELLVLRFLVFISHLKPKKLSGRHQVGKLALDASFVVLLLAGLNLIKPKPDCLAGALGDLGTLLSEDHQEMLDLVHLAPLDESLES
jgi:hypothetical protein